ncbi:DUF3459 domain-containing protein [Streptomyces sp. T028]|uniref:DUF3459 domain-containing protein n=1 Tax=Streptomyces sp. T028 TaxID=3394379 RepID=UPI003A8A2843
MLAFHRAPGLVCVLNLSDEAHRLPDRTTVLLASGPVEDGLLEPDHAAWLKK